MPRERGSLGGVRLEKTEKLKTDTSTDVQNNATRYLFTKVM